jgi:Domain of unknown function (DUF6429)
MLRVPPVIELHEPPRIIAPHQPISQGEQPSIDGCVAWCCPGVIEPTASAAKHHALDRLYRKRMIDNPVGKAKSVVLTDEGLSESERLFRKLFERSEG